MAIIGNAYIVVHAVTTGFQDDVNKQLNGLSRQFDNVGRQAGRSFSSGLSNGSKSLTRFQKEALAANDAFQMMVMKGYAMGPAISVAVGAVSNLVSGLFALVAQIGSAVPALFTLVGAFAALGQAMLAGKLAFSGIGAAFKQLTKQGGGAASSASRVEQAERNLARVLEQNREALTRANERLADAEERLTEARKEAAEWLQQLNFDAEDAAIAEQRAALALEDARLSLMRVQDLPPDSRARQEAELAYAEADLNLRRAIDRNQDLATETDEANQKGVEGSRQVVDATRAVQDAIDDRARTERDALRSLIDAQNALNEARSGGGGGGGGADALKELSEEARRFVEYLVSIKDKTKDLKAAAGRELFPQLETALDSIVNKLFPAFVPVLEATGKALGKSAVDFSNLVTEANELEKFERVGKNNTYVIGNLGKVVGNLYSSFLSLMDAADPLIRRFTDWVVTLTDGWRESLNAKNATGELTDMFNKAGDAAAQIGDILSNIWDGLMNLGKAASGPGSGGQQLMDTFQKATERFVEFTDQIGKDGTAQQFFLDVADGFTSISGLLSDIVGGFVSLGNEEGIGATADKLREAGPAIREMLEKLIGGAPAMADALVKLADFFNVFTENESINAFFKTLGVTLGILNKVFGSGPGMAILGFIAPIMGVVKALSLMNKVGGFAGRVLFGYGLKAKGAADASKGLVGMLKGGAKGIKTFGQNFKYAKTAGEGFFSSLKFAGGMTKIGGALSKAAGGVKAFGLALKAAFLANPVGMVVAAIAALIAILVVLYKKWKPFRDLVNFLAGGIVKGLKAAWEGVKNFFIKIFTGLVEWFMDFFGIASPSKLFADFGMAILNGLLNGLKAVAGAIWGFFSDLVGAVVGFFIELPGKLATAFGEGFSWLKDKIVAFVTWYFEKWWAIVQFFIDLPGKLAGAFGDGFSWLKDKIVQIKDFYVEKFMQVVDFVTSLPGKIASAASGMWDGIKDAFKAAINFIIRKWNNLSFSIPGFKIPFTDIGFDGFTLQLPDIPEFAAGGIVNRATMAVVGEAGPEAIIPLNNKLRAMQLMQQSGLAGLARAAAVTSAAGANNLGAPPFTVNVYPSEGMDEAELASLVGRQVALQLRTGTFSR